MHINEFEFTLVLKQSRDYEKKEAIATLIEFWPTIERLSSQRVEVLIPAEHKHLFNFPVTTNFYIKNML